jgi:Leucine-rich repeat (LRR) protein
LADIKGLSDLHEVHLDSTLVSDIMPLANNKALTKVYCDATGVKTTNVLSFLTVNPNCLVIYQTTGLRFWWNNLPESWQSEFSTQIGIDGNPSKEQLQLMAGLKEITINNNSSITDIESVSVCHVLKTLSISFTGITDLSPLVELDSLRVLNLPNNPITDLEPLSRLTQLVELNLENTGIDDLSPIATLTNLQKLNVAGTRVRRLKPLSSLVHLRELTINNTKVSRLTTLYGLHNLERLTCYNTSLRKKRVDEFKAAHPGVEVVFY